MRIVNRVYNEELVRSNKLKKGNARLVLHGCEAMDFATYVN